MSILRRMCLRLKPHYLIIGKHTQSPIGCTIGRKGKAEVLEEEPGSKFVRCSRRKCPVCGEQ